MIRVFLKTLVAVLVVMSITVPVRSQTITGTLVGRILDEKKGPLTDVLVRVVNLQNGFEHSGITGVDGYYRIDFIPPGEYRIDASKQGFQSSGIKSYVAEVNTTRVFEPPPIQLFPVGAAGGTSGPVDARIQANTADATLRGGTRGVALLSLPLAGVRSFDQFALLLPGVAPPPENSGANGPGIGPGVGTAGQFSVNGQRARSNNFTVDGSDSNDQDVGVRRQGFTATLPQPVETVAEFQVTTLLSDAEAGRNTGGQVNVVTRGGASEFHGQAYAFFTDDALNARDAFDTRAERPGEGLGAFDDASLAKNPFRRAQVGFVVGGPISRTKVRYFLGGERQNVDRTTDQHFVTPTQGQRNAALQLPFAGETLGLEVLFPAFYPQPNNSGGPYGANTFTQSIEADGRGTVATGKVDAQFPVFGRETTFNGRYSVADDTTKLPTVAQAINSSILAKVRTQTVALAFNTAVSAVTANQVRISYGRTALGFDEVAGSPFLFSSPTINVHGSGGTGPIGRLVINPYSSLGVDPFTFPQSRATNTYQFADSLVLTRGSHCLKGGTDVRSVQFNSRLDRNYRPQVTFAPSFLSIGLGLARSVSGLVSAAYGKPADVTQALAIDADSSLALRFTEIDAYAHDTWRIGPRVVVTAGLRYELNTVPTDATGRLERRLTLSVVDIPGANRRGAEDFVDAFEAQRRVLGGRERIYDSDKNNVAPRVGVAWDIAGDGRYALRAGYGVYYDALLGSVVSQSRNIFPSFIPLNLGGGTSFLRLVDIPYLNPGSLSYNGRRLLVPGTSTINIAQEDIPLVLGAFKFLGAFPLAFTLPEKALRTPYVHELTASLEGAIGENYLARVAYVGTAGHKLLRLRTPNGGPNSPLAIVALRRSLLVSSLFDVSNRPVSDLGAYTLIESSANANYHALQTSLELRERERLWFRLAYTWSHAIDEASDLFDLAGAPALAQDELGKNGGLRLERGDASFDVRHRFVASWRWELPFAKPHSLLDEFDLSGVLTLSSGQPFTVGTSVDANFDGNPTDRLGTTAGLVTVNDGPVRLALVSGVSPEQLLPFIARHPSRSLGGVVGRNTFRAQGIASLDLALTKRFEIGGDRAITVRVEGFNVFNRSHFGVPVRILEAPAFGRSTYTTIPNRVLQVALRYTF